MKWPRIVALVSMMMSLFGGSVAAADEGFSRKGADTCLQCHNGDNFPNVLKIFGSPHGAKAVFSQGQCEACHGPVSEHDKGRLRKGETRAAMFDFSGKQPGFGPEKITQVCSSCHAKEIATHFSNSVHEQNQASCTSCHSIHTSHDPVKTAQGQLETCGTCHLAAKAQHSRFSHHPVKEGKMRCTSCHNPHDSKHEQMLAKDSVVATCTQCHAGKRGPFLFEHEPVAENCAHCHNPHGSNHQGMLKQRLPMLCQQCHSGDGHQGTMPSNQNLFGQSPSAFVIGQSCTNCHSAVHGSNHPSGNKLQR